MKRRDRDEQPPRRVNRWLGGAHAVEETLRSKPQTVQELWVEHEAKSPAIAQAIRLARATGIRIQFMARKAIDRALNGGRHQGMAIKVLEEPGQGFDAFLKILSDQEKPGLVLVALDQIQDPHNLGAIARSAANLGAAGLIIPERRSSPLSAVAVQASAGAIQKLKVFKVVNLAQALERCKQAGFWIYGADAGGRAVWDAALNFPLVLVIGSEGCGMRPLIQSSCDELVKIPQSSGGVESLNASCAASVLLYEIARQAAGVRNK
ncbi:MAG: 23S rRNA (guanosine(2251)-2'-O)-methyltransferase RlmB [Elusimicrobia bacterium RIFCSPHIGHO2_02_FULL_57_9]|nr:MAG: 23S rRNA (guanosine(2251)-2'-O)-methyltransferase RlmB [Elusimicrobia bacterium RIFCSPHIGHO2_02_FULL_57_9]